MINYGIIDDSIEFYTKEGFQRVEAPWTVTPAISMVDMVAFRCKCNESPSPWEPI